MSKKVFTFVKYTFGDEKIIYTFDGVTNGSLQIRMIMNIMHDCTEKKIYVISGCHGVKNGNNWEKNGKKGGLQNRTIEKNILRHNE